MPELAEVEFFRKRWTPGFGEPVREVFVREAARVFRGCDVGELKRALPGARIEESESHGKQMLFRFRRTRRRNVDAWLGIHLGMTGKLASEKAGLSPGVGEHLVLRTDSRSLVFSDPRKFGRIRFEVGNEPPSWWRSLPPAILSDGWTLSYFLAFLDRHRRASLKGLLLMQEGFPGIGNWMADEILWRAGLMPSRAAESLSGEEKRRLRRAVREVVRQSIATVGEDYSDPPDGWLFHVRWKDGGRCPRTGGPLVRETIAGRTTCWSPTRQK